MPARGVTRRRRAWVIFAVILSGAVAGGAGAGSQIQKIRISQRDQAFRPGELTIHRGDMLQIANDDDDVLHHAFVDSEKFKFDSGDQEPGTTVEVAFPTSGTFTVRCGIHPRMRLKVQVE